MFCLLLFVIWVNQPFMISVFKQHGGSVVCIVISQHEGSKFEPCLGHLWPFYVESACSLYVCVGFLPPQNTCILGIR